VERTGRTGALVRRGHVRVKVLAAVIGVLAFETPAVAATRGSASQGRPPTPAGASTPAVTAAEPPAAAAEPGSELTIYLVTMGPGDAVWERFGHNALWIRDAATGQDLAYNYGMFDFDEPGFLRNFIRGRLNYWVQPVDAEAMVRAYVAANRSVWVQELNLTPQQRLELKRFLEWNSLPENRTYRYDYYRDNCSTRVRDAIDMVLAGRLREVLDAEPSGMTYRTHTRRLVADDLPVFYGLEVAMTRAIDVPLTRWAESFLPMELMENIRRVTVIDESGREAPLVKAETLLFEASRPPVPEGVPDRVPASLAAGTVLGAALALSGRGAAQRRGPRVVFLLLAGVWAAVTGVLGILLSFLWLGTDHWVTYGNENLLQANPLALVLLVLLPLATRRGTRARAALHWTAAALALLSIAGFALQALPGFDQMNGEIIALALPVHVGLAAGVTLGFARRERRVRVAALQGATAP